MKKLMLILSIFGLLALSSCNKPGVDIDNEKVTNITTSNPITSKTEPRKTTSSNTETEPKDKSTSTKTNDKDIISTLPDYDDGIDWHGTID